MQNLFDSEDRREILARLARLNTDSQRQWGTMNQAQALCHMGDQLALALGEIDVPRRKTLLGMTPFNYVAIYLLPWPRGVKTAPELLQTQIEEIDAARSRLLELIERFVARSAEGSWTAHPMFGALGGKTWGYLAIRHLDHHLRQFGV